MQPVKPERNIPLRIQADQGYYAFSRGWLSNQYDPASNAGKDWQRGFDRAYYEDLVHVYGNASDR
jgi:hypothetical protein